MYLLVKNNKKYLALLFTLKISLSFGFRLVALVLIVFIVVFALPYFYMSLSPVSGTVPIGSRIIARISLV